VFVALNTIQGANRSAQTQVASDALMHSQRIGKAAPNAVQGSVEGFRQLEESRKELNKDINLMTRGGQYQGRSIGEPRPISPWWWLPRASSGPRPTSRPAPS
jgi:twitching motility protein PilJ